MPILPLNPMPVPSAGETRRFAFLRGRRGFIIILIVGMLAVLSVLGIAFAEQSRVELMGASNSRDLAATDGLAETGFQFALRALADDTHVWSAKNAGWDTRKGVGWTSRWGYNPFLVAPPTGVTLPNAGDRAPNRANPQNFLDSWQLLMWNEEDRGGNEAYRYYFQFDLADPKSKWSQRVPPDEKVMQDVWQLQPLCRVRRYLVSCGTSYGILQISVQPRDGAVNVNDVFDPGTVDELPGWHDTLPAGSGEAAPIANTDPRVPYASPDRRTLEYILGKRPEYANLNEEMQAENETGNKNQPEANMLHGNSFVDDGVYNFYKMFEPRGWFDPAGATVPTPYLAWYGYGYVTSAPSACPTTFYNSDKTQTNRYNFEGARYIMWANSRPMSSRWDYGVIGDLIGNNFLNTWYPSGRFNVDPAVDPLYQNDPNSYASWNYWAPVPKGSMDALFEGFGFDMINPRRGGTGTAPNPWLFTQPAGLDLKYVGAGAYGHAHPQSFQRHFIAAGAKGRFWSDLTASWYFGGAPGYSTCMGGSQNWEWVKTGWAFLGGSYSSLGIGSHWMPPTMHVWMPGYSTSWWYDPTFDTARGLKRDPGSMLPCKPAATYAYPLHKWDDDYGIGNAHFTYNDVRAGGVRAHGIQEDWGLWGQDDNGHNGKGRTYDAININVTNFQTVYGLLTPEKIPSMLNRTVVAPHLHWKSRMLDGAYEGMETFKRYDPNNPGVLTAYTPPNFPVPATGTARDGLIPEFPVGAPQSVMKDYLYGRLTNPGLPYDPATNPVIPYDATATGASAIYPVYYKYSIHRHKDATSPGVRIWGKMDFTTNDPRTNLPADDVYGDCHYDITLSPNSTNAADNLPNSLQMPRPDDALTFSNWADWFMQLRKVIPNAKTLAPYTKPLGNKGVGGFLPYPEGISGTLLALAPDGARSTPSPKPHPLYGLPNPDYMLLYPGTKVSYNWADQFRRYFPLYDWEPDPLKDSKFAAPPLQYKMIDPKEVSANNPIPVDPSIPVAKSPAMDGNTPFVPGISKDEGWRITRIGRKYQEIIADEIMDYQINPWWPNPIVHFSEAGTPLDKRAYKSDARIGASALATPKWDSNSESAADPGIEYQIPDYYAYFNRFWCRSASKYDRAEADYTKRGQAYQPDQDVSKPTNGVENRNMYPQSLQYFGQSPLPALVRWWDHIIDFPYNTLEDQSGSEWRYNSGALTSMLEPGLRAAPARNHPFKTWADFVAMLGHLVYRSPMPAIKRDSLMGVSAAAVCPASFFDGSVIDDADALQLGVVARKPYWPISGNYGEFYDPVANGPAPYPPMTAPWTNQAEWERRIDEWRGRDAAGIRIEHNYISEAAANDVLVSFSNGRVKPIDFDGDGIIRMTRRDEIPEVDKYWPGYPYHNLVGNDTVVTSQRKPGIDYNKITDATPLDYGLKTDVAAQAVPKNQIIQGCVTLPIKFRSNTFRVTVLVSLTDPQFRNIYSTRRYSRVYSRIPGPPTGNIKVHGPYTGEFYQQGSRIMAGADPEMSWLGVK